MFGVYDDDIVPNSGDAGSASYEDAIAPLMDILSTFRDQIKERAGEGEGLIVKLCEELTSSIEAKETPPLALPLLA